MGPWIEIMNNTFTNINSPLKPLILLNGVQHSFIKNNNFIGCNQGAAFIEYKDEVRAAHILSDNKIENCGLIIKNEFVANK
jgi:nitrous oxidase accessory protein NosD